MAFKRFNFHLFFVFIINFTIQMTKKFILFKCPNGNARIKLVDCGIVTVALIHHQIVLSHPMKPILLTNNFRTTNTKLQN